MQTSELKSKLSAALEHLKSELSQIRAGRATTALVEEIQVEAYGSTMKVKELGTISTPDAQMILITPWDKSLLKDVDKAIRNSGLGLNPVPDSQSVKVPVPSLSEERRREFTRLVTDKTENAKNSMRGIRQDVMKNIDRELSEGLITEDDKFSMKEEVEKIVKEFVQKADELSEIKKKDLMSV